MLAGQLHRGEASCAQVPVETQLARLVRERDAALADKQRLATRFMDLCFDGEGVCRSCGRAHRGAPLAEHDHRCSVAHALAG